jgi:hypothetical protein
MTVARRAGMELPALLFDPVPNWLPPNDNDDENDVGS